MNVCDRFQPPPGYSRTDVETETFAHYLRNLPLKPDGSEVLYHNGNVKKNFRVYDAVVDLPIGSKDLHQCADAVMRLRAEFLWTQERYDEIHFNFTNGMKVDYAKWMTGQRIRVEGNKTTWVQQRSPSNTHQDFWSYMEQIFIYAGTASLEKELKTIEWDEMQIGDVLIQGGYPGHAVMVVDMVVNAKTGKKLYLLGQSYMPAQEFQILKNSGTSISPWYSHEISKTITTPEWTFYKADLRRF